jgi:hypothetical protein
LVFVGTRKTQAEAGRHEAEPNPPKPRTGTEVEFPERLAEGELIDGHDGRSAREQQRRGAAKSESDSERDDDDNTTTTTTSRTTGATRGSRRESSSYTVQESYTAVCFAGGAG